MNRDRKPYVPENGQIYRNHGGGIFRCKSAAFRSNWHGICARMENVASGWTFQANGIHGYPDGSIDWNFSTGGHFQEGKPRSITGGQNG